MTVELEQVEKMTAVTPGRWLVKKGGEIVGMLEKIKDTRADQHPWQAYKGWGMAAEFIGSFFPNDGGKTEAIKSIVGE